MSIHRLRLLPCCTLPARAPILCAPLRPPPTLSLVCALVAAGLAPLVKTINELFGRGTQTLVMAWDRRMDESKAFFDMMEAEGYAS